MEDIYNFSPDIRSLAENVHIGPQADVQELVDSFNNSYIIRTENEYRGSLKPFNLKPLALTKKFYWKPGSYDIIKEVITRLLEMHKKAPSLNKIVDRVKNDGNWRMRSLNTQLVEIETKLANLRCRGIIQQDNTDNAIEAWNIVRNHFIEQLETCNSFFEIYGEEVRDTNNNIIDYNIRVQYKHNNPKIKYQVANTDDTMAEIELPGEVIIDIKLSVSRLINATIIANMDISKFNNRSIQARRYNSRIWGYDIGGVYINEYSLEHPYISRDQAHWNRSSHFNAMFRYVCTGNLEPEFHACIKNLDFISLYVFVNRLVTHYDTRTGPLNQISDSYHGRPEFLEDQEDYYNVVGRTRLDNCRMASSINRGNYEREYLKTDSYCNKFCSAKDICTSYIDATTIPEPLTQEEVERLALEKATLKSLGITNQRRL